VRSSGADSASLLRVDDDIGRPGPNFDSAPGPVAGAVGRRVADNITPPQVFDDPAIVVPQTFDVVWEVRLAAREVRDVLQEVVIDFRTEPDRIDRRIRLSEKVEDVLGRAHTPWRGARIVLIPPVSNQHDRTAAVYVV